MDELKPCPFCSGEAKLRFIDNSYWVECVNLTCQIKCLKTYRCGTEKEAVRLWNTRIERTCLIDNAGRCSFCGDGMMGGYDRETVLRWIDAGNGLKTVKGFPANYCPNCGSKVINAKEGA